MSCVSKVLFLVSEVFSQYHLSLNTVSLVEEFLTNDGSTLPHQMSLRPRQSKSEVKSTFLGEIVLMWGIPRSTQTTDALHPDMSRPVKTVYVLSTLPIVNKVKEGTNWLRNNSDLKTNLRGRLVRTELEEEKCPQLTRWVWGRVVVEYLFRLKDLDPDPTPFYSWFPCFKFLRKWEITIEIWTCFDSSSWRNLKHRIRGVNGVGSGLGRWTLSTILLTRFFPPLFNPKTSV